MTSQSYLFPIGLWSAAVGFQIGTAIRDYWQRRTGRTTPTTGYEKVLNGETVNGWRLAVFSGRFREMCDQSHDSCYVFPKEPESNAEMITQAVEDEMSMLVNHAYYAADGRRVITLSRVSLIAPNVTSTIYQINCPRKWSFRGCSYLSKRSIVTIFRKRSGKEWMHRLVFFDLIAKSHRVITLEPPPEFSDLRSSDLFLIHPGMMKRRYLSVVYSSTSTPDDNDEDGKWIQNFQETHYEIPDSKEPVLSPIEESSWQSVSIPALEGCSTWWTDYCLHPQQAILIEGEESAIENHRCFLYDRQGNWEITRLTEWLALFRATTHGAKLTNAAEALAALSPPEECKLCSVPSFEFANGVIIGGVLYWLGKGTVLQRYLYPPSLKRLAVEAFIRSHKEFDLAKLKQLIGFDVFNISEDDSPVIYF